MKMLFFLQGNPTIFLESTIHSDEWITVASATYLLNELVSSNRTEMRYLAENYDWIIVPVTNVDGYEYTHTTVSCKIILPYFLLRFSNVSIYYPKYDVGKKEEHLNLIDNFCYYRIVCGANHGSRIPHVRLALE